MIFDLGCCCTVPSGGIYDFWRFGGTPSQVADDKDNTHIISRAPSQQLIISGYLDDAAVDGGNYNGMQVTSYSIGDYMELFTETGQQFPIEPTIQWDGTASVKSVGEERLWYQANVARTGGYDFFNHSGIGYSSNRTIGDGARIENDYLVLTTGDVTSGCFVRWEFPQTHARNLEFNIPFTFDKTILCTISGTGQSNEHWYKPSNIGLVGSQTYNVIKAYLAGNPYFTGSDFNLVESEFYYPGESGLNIHISYSVDAGDVADLTTVELRLVDDTGVYTIDDVSGYSLRIRNLLMPTYTGINPTVDKILLYTDPVNKEILSSTVLRSDSYFLTGLFDTDIYKYTISNYGSGSSDYELFSFSNINESIRYDGDTDIEMFSFNYASPFNTGSIVVDRLLNNKIGDNFTNYYQINTLYSRTIFTNVYNASPSNILFPEIRHWCYSPITTRQSYISQLGSEYSRLVPFSYNYLETTGSKTRWYGFNHLHGLIEYDIPQSEKERFYEKMLNPSGQDYYASDIDLWNTDVNLPVICKLDYDNKPNAFSIVLPKQNFVEGTGTTSVNSANVGTSKSGTLSQTVKIIYGPIVQNTYSVTGLSGIHFSGINIQTSDMSGTAGIRPHTTFNYTSGSVQVGRAYSFEFDLLHGDITGETIWEDTFEQNVPYTPTFYTSVTSPYTGLFNSPTTLNCTAIPLWGGKHIATNKIGCSFIHSRNHLFNGYVSGEAYIKVCIDGNIIHSQRLYADDGALTSYPPIKGPYVLHATEEDLRNNMSGSYAAFVWFELLYETQPRPTTTISATGAGSMTGWEMHVCNQTGQELWSVPHSGLLSWFNTSPYVGDSSDRFFYVNNFNMAQTGVSYSALSVTPRTEIISGSQYRYYGGPGIISGMTSSWGFAHDRSALIPAGWEDTYPVTISGDTRDIYSRQIEFNILEGNCIKNSSLFEEAPTIDGFRTSFPYTGMYYTYTGLDPFFPSGFSACMDEFYIHPHFQYFTSPIDLTGSYAGYRPVDSGNYITLDQDYLGLVDAYPDLCGDIWLYVASGITNSGWL